MLVLVLVLVLMLELVLELELELEVQMLILMLMLMPVLMLVSFTRSALLTLLPKLKVNASIQSVLVVSHQLPVRRGLHGLCMGVGCKTVGEQGVFSITNICSAGSACQSYCAASWTSNSP